MRFIRTLILIGACALVASGCTLYSFGQNSFGELGDGTAKTRLDPVPAARNPDWLEVDSGYYHSCGIDVSLALYCWGDNTYGALGLGTSGYFTSKRVPTRVGTANDWTGIDAAGGQGSTCGINGGSVFCWGANVSGQLGVGDTNSRLSPTQVGTATDWKQVATGGNHGCGIRTSGALFCWGENTHGEVGDGTNESRLTPVQVGTATDWKLVRAGYLHTCGIRGSGALFCWGDNYSGQIGDGTIGFFESRNTPTQIGTSTGWSSVATGEGHTCAIRGGAIFCWGSNGAGELGNGTFSGPNDPAPGNPVPTQVGTATNWTDIAAGSGDSCGIRANSLLFCWGNYASGDGTATTYNLPTQAQLDKWATISLGGLHKEGLRNLG